MPINDDNASSSAPDSSAKAGTGGAGAGAKSLDDLLASWESPSSDNSGDDRSSVDKAAPSDKTDPQEARIRALEEQLAASAYRNEMASVVSTVKGDLEVDDDLVEYWVNKRAESDPRLVSLWENRDGNAGRFKSALNALKEEFGEFAKERLVVGQAQNRESSRRAASAVAGARETPSGMAHGLDNVNWGSLGDSEFALKKAEVFRLQSAGKL